MDTDSYFNARRRRTSLLSGRAVHEALENSPNCRPHAVERAKEFIADPGFPPPGMRRKLARHLAAKLLADFDAMP